MQGTLNYTIMLICLDCILVSRLDPLLQATHVSLLNPLQPNKVPISVCSGPFTLVKYS